MKHRKLVLIAILFVLAILTTNVIAGIKDNRLFKFLNKNSGDKGAWTAIAAIIGIFMTLIIPNLIDIILMNPTVAGPDANPAIVNTVNSFLYLLVPFYTIAIVITGIYFLFSQSPSGRAKSKSMFLKLIISMGAVLIALPLFQLLLDISQGITQLIFSVGENYVDIGNVFYGTISLSTILSLAFSVVSSGKLISFMFLLFLGLTLITVTLILVMRYLIVVFAAIVFPFTLVLWLFDFPYTKHIGSELMNHTIVWIFVPVITASVVVLTSIIAGGFSEKCSVSEITTIFSLGNNVLANCLLSYFAGIAATFLILAAPLMMYDIMPWLGATILFFGWAAMAAPTPAQGAGGPVGLRYFGLPGADAVLRIPGVENVLDKAFGLRPLYGLDGRILGMTTVIDGLAPGEIPMSAPPIYKGLRGIVRRIRGQPAVGEGVATKMATATHYGKEIKYPIFDPKKEYATWYNPYHSRTVIPKLGPLAVVAAGGVLAGMGPLGIVTAGLKGLWYEPGARFPMEANVPLATGGSTRVLAPEWYVRQYSPEGILAAKSPYALKEYYPHEYNELLSTVAGRQRLAELMNVGPGEVSHAPMPPPQAPEEAAEKKRRDAQEEFDRMRRNIENERLRGVIKEEVYKAKLQKAGGVRDKKLRDIDVELKKGEGMPISKRAMKEGRTPEEIYKEKIGRLERMYVTDVDKFEETGEGGPRKKLLTTRQKAMDKIGKELLEARTYVETPQEMEKRAKLMVLPQWLAFGQAARILSRQGQLMHGLKAFKVYTPTPPRIPDWTKKRWEAEEARKRQ